MKLFLNIQKCDYNAGPLKAIDDFFFVKWKYGLNYSLFIFFMKWFFRRDSRDHHQCRASRCSGSGSGWTRHPSWVGRTQDDCTTSRSGCVTATQATGLWPNRLALFLINLFLIIVIVCWIIENLKTNFYVKKYENHESAVLLPDSFYMHAYIEREKLPAAAGKKSFPAGGRKKEIFSFYFNFDCSDFSNEKIDAVFFFLMKLFFRSEIGGKDRWRP